MGGIIYPSGRVEFGLFCMWENEGDDKNWLREKDSLFQSLFNTLNLNIMIHSMYKQNNQLKYENWNVNKVK